MTAQFRLARVQLVNWGTFDGYYDIPVGERGFLVTGASGSGKSTLIDAFSAVLVPPGKLRFNAAAQQETGREKGRSRVSYIRGAWRRSEDPATGEIRSQYLRPGATASIVALTYRAGEEVLTLAAIYRLNAGQQQEAQVKTLYGIFPSEVDVDGFVPLLQNSLDKRKLEAAYKTAGVTFTEQYSVFANRFRSKLGIGSEEAQMLLHRTQSAKSLGSMDELFRNYMLDTPRTFQVAEDAVATHEDLRQAYERLEDVHQQIETLAPLPGLHSKLKNAQATQENTAALSAALPHVRRAIEAKHGWKVRVVDLRWLAPLNEGFIREQAAGAKRILVVDDDQALAEMLGIVLRKGYGLGAQAMAAGSFHSPLLTAAWPSGEFGAMGLEGAVRLGFAKELAAQPDEAARQALFDKLVAKAYDNGKALNMASYLEIDAVIDPAESRAWLLRGLNAAPIPAPRTGKKRPFVDTW